MAITDVAAPRMPPLTPPASRNFGMRQRPPSPAPATPLSPSQQHPAERLVTLAQDLLDRGTAFVRRLRPSRATAKRAAIYALLYADFRHTFPRLVAYVGALALLAGGAVQIFRAAPVAAGIEPAPRPEWTTVSKPFPAFSLAMPELISAGTNYEIRRHSTGGGRKEILSWGELGGDGPNLVVEIYRPGTEFTRFGNAALEIASRTEEQVAPADIRPAETIESKFGPIPAVEFGTKSGASRQCLGFVRDFDRPRMQLAGWYCAAASEQLEHGTVSCALDRLTLLAAGSDAKLGELFARAELKRNFCGQRSVLIAPTPKLGPAASQPPLRGRLSAR